MESIGHEFGRGLLFCSSYRKFKLWRYKLWRFDCVVLMQTGNFLIMMICQKYFNYAQFCVVPFKKLGLPTFKSEAKYNIKFS